MEALQQRLEKYQESSAAAKEEGNSGKARRMDRIVKVSLSPLVVWHADAIWHISSSQLIDKIVLFLQQYQDSIKCHKAGKPVDYEDLPAPPGRETPIVACLLEPFGLKSYLNFGLKPTNEFFLICLFSLPIMIYCLYLNNIPQVFHRSQPLHPPPRR